jgi:hypothetical protein
VRHAPHVAELAEQQRESAENDGRDAGADERRSEHARALAELGVDRRLQRDQRADEERRDHGEQAGHGAAFPRRWRIPCRE